MMDSRKKEQYEAGLRPSSAQDLATVQQLAIICVPWSKQGLTVT
jgi:hypothetical protein